MPKDKYIMTDETKIIGGHVLHRIEATKSFNEILAGQLGGFIESPKNLSPHGKAWITDDACVYGDAVVEDNAMVWDNACIRNHAIICGNAAVYDNAMVGDTAIVDGNASVYGDAYVLDDAHIGGRANVYGSAWICDGAELVGHADIQQTSDYMFFRINKEPITIFRDRKHKVAVCYYNDELRQCRRLLESTRAVKTRIKRGLQDIFKRSEQNE